jgi:inorganic pyrophosphatase
MIFSSKEYKTGDEVHVEIIGLLKREDEDHKIMAVDDSVTIKSFSEVPIKERGLILEFFGYASKILSVEERDKAVEYLKSTLV